MLRRNEYLNEPLIGAHGDSIERIAIVGDERWRSETLMFATADLRRAPVEFVYSQNGLAEARTWLAA